ncbi:GNAT family N-acetyltransferase [Psychrobacillus sp. INOP01]|uniref:GNAT family N-acetyltransferase n=1 Tax=Psychrobacillus sp. INOP01 TaxID=2829187 RepID=UPI001BA8B095|nr:GNAT family N-acetyltransferase [Psychrobacillus sp. INOP01]QUG43410.1 GNAT family N-acetyltransferase [Psychrobacillus sp. INOP01]
MWNYMAFEELSVLELQRIYKERVAVFVVEQNCPYPEVDDVDLISTHIFKEENNELCAYMRVIPKEDNIHIGRVLVAQNHRKSGLGRELVARGLEYIETIYPGMPIYAQAQAHLEDFYRSFGFETVSEVYLEDNIPHIDMVVPAGEVD